MDFHSDRDSTHVDETENNDGICKDEESVVSEAKEHDTDEHNNNTNNSAITLELYVKLVSKGFTVLDLFTLSEPCC